MVMAPVATTTCEMCLTIFTARSENPIDPAKMLGYTNGCSGLGRGKEAIKVALVHQFTVVGPEVFPDGDLTQSNLLVRRTDPFARFDRLVKVTSCSAVPVSLIGCFLS